MKKKNFYREHIKTDDEEIDYIKADDIKDIMEDDENIIEDDDVKPSEVKTNDGELNNVKPSEVKTRDVKLNGTKPDDVKLIDIKINDLNAQTIAACVHALGLIAGDKAFAALETYASAVGNLDFDSKKIIGVEFGQAWNSFPKKAYLECVLCHCTVLSLNKLPEVRELKSLKGLIYLAIYDSPGLTKLQFSSLPMLETLEISSCHNLRDIGELRELQNLKVIRLKYCPEIEYFLPLFGLPNLDEIEIQKCGHNIKENFSLLSPSIARIKIYDSNGNKIYTRNHENLSHDMP